MPTYKAKLKRREEVAEGTMAFYFQKPAGFEFRAGQFCNFTLLDPPETDAEGNLRSFSIASAPLEEDLMIATRMRDSAFKRVLKRTPLEIEVELDGPFGSFTLQADAARPAVFLAGGIGITPFRSIVVEATRKKLPHQVLLFYSNRRPEDAAFQRELQEIERQNANYKFIPTMTQMEKSQRVWKGESGLINSQMLSKYLNDLATPIYYGAGPPAMVTAMREMLLRTGVSEDNIRTEDFAGY